MYNTLSSQSYVRSLQRVLYQSLYMLLDIYLLNQSYHLRNFIAIKSSKLLIGSLTVPTAAADKNPSFVVKMSFERKFADA